MSLSEADTRAKLINPALYTRGWQENYIKREETAGAVEMREGEAHRRSRGQMDYSLWIEVIQEGLHRISKRK